MGTINLFIENIVNIFIVQYIFDRPCIKTESSRVQGVRLVLFGFLRDLWGKKHRHYEMRFFLYFPAVFVAQINLPHKKDDIFF